MFSVSMYMFGMCEKSAPLQNSTRRGHQQLATVPWAVWLQAGPSRSDLR